MSFFATKTSRQKPGLAGLLWFACVLPVTPGGTWAQTTEGGPKAVSPANPSQRTGQVATLSLWPGIFATTSANLPYAFQLLATGGVPPYHHAVTAGALPTGMSLTDGGELRGTPDAGGTYNFSITVTDSLGAFGLRAYAFTVGPGMITVVSRKSHGPAGNLELPINPAGKIGGPVTIEPRVAGSGHVLVYQFSEPITSPGSASVTPVGTAVTSFSGNEVRVTLAGVPVNQRVSVLLDGVNGTISTPPVSIGFLPGDVDASGTVTSNDIARIRARAGQIASATNAPYDLNLGGSVNASDIAAAKVRVGAAQPPADLPGGVSVDGYAIPVPSKIPGINTPPPHAGPQNGAGEKVNAWAVDAGRCTNSAPQVTRAWRHNIDFVEHAAQSNIDYWDMAPDEALTYRFVAPSPGFGRIDVLGSVLWPFPVTFVSISSSPCDFDLGKLTASPLPDFCYRAQANQVLLNFEVTNADSATLGYCRMVPGQIYYLNLRFQNSFTVPGADSCAALGAARCGGILQIRKP